MPLAWGERKRLIRLAGIADELLNATRIPRDSASAQAVGAEVAAVADEVASVLGEADARLADEFTRVVVRTGDDRPVDVRAAALAGWLRAQIHVENLDEARAQFAVGEAERRKLTIGFRVRPRGAGDAPPAS